MNTQQVRRQDQLRRFLDALGLCEENKNLAEEYLLADEFGSFAGRGWSGIYSVSLPYKAVTVSRPGKVIFIIRQIMDTDSLVGVRDVGLKGLAATCR